MEFSDESHQSKGLSCVSAFFTTYPEDANAVICDVDVAQSDVVRGSYVRCKALWDTGAGNDDGTTGTGETGRTGETETTAGEKGLGIGDYWDGDVSDNAMGWIGRGRTTNWLPRRYGFGVELGLRK